MNSKDKAKKIFTKNRNIVAFALIATLLWGSAFPGVKIGYEMFRIEGADMGGKMLFAGLRFSMAGLLTLFFAFAYNKKVIIPTSKNIKGIVSLGIIQTFFQYIFFYIGLSNTTGSKGAIINSTGTFITVILAFLIFKNEVFNRRKVIGCLLGFLGIILVNIRGVNTLDFRLQGEGFLLLAALSFAIGSIVSKFIAKEEDPLVLTGYQMMFGGILLVLFSLANGGSIHRITFSGMVMLLYLSILSALAFSIWMTLLKYNSVSKITMFNSMVPVFGVILSALLLQENIINMQTIAAFLLVPVGIYLVNRD